MSTYQLAVMGNPIWQSQSPIIHKMFAEEFNLSISYERVLVPNGSFEQIALVYVGGLLLVRGRDAAGGEAEVEMAVVAREEDLIPLV